MSRRKGIIRAVLVRTGLAIAAGWAVYSMSGQPETGILKVEIRDKANGQVAPAMVCISSAADKSWRVPESAAPRITGVRDFMEPGEWKPGQIGPVRATVGDTKQTRRLGIYEGISDYAFWQEPVAYFVSRPFSITLPAGKWRLAIEHGIEYLPVFEDFEIAAGETRNRKIVLSRWVDMPREGWYSGDDHIHHPRLKPEHNEFLMTWAKAEDVHVANILRMGDIKQTYFEQTGYGKAFRYQQGDYVLATGQEDPRTDIPEQGHTIALNITAPVRDTSQYHLYDTMFDGAHEQGALTGYAHLAWAPEYHRTHTNPRPFPSWDPTINAIRGKVDFFEILQFRRLGLEDFYDFLNLGVKLIASSGSDFPWGDTFGESRVFVYTGRHLSADKWFEALKQGHTFVTNGPMLSLSADKAIPGDDLIARKNADVRVRVRAWAPPLIGSPKKLELISHGKVIQSAEATGTEQEELKIEFTLRASESQWIAARVTSQNGALAHTSPIYIMVDNRSFRDGSQLAQIAEKHIKVLDYIAGRLKDEKFTREYTPGEVGALEGRVDEAREKYKKLAAQ